MGAVIKGFKMITFKQIKDEISKRGVTVSVSRGKKASKSAIYRVEDKDGVHFVNWGELVYAYCMGNI